MKFSILLLLFTLSSSFSWGQEMFYENIEWESSPVYEKLDDKYKDEKEVDLFYTRTVQFAYDESMDNRLVEYFTIHNKVRVVSDEAVQDNNKVYIGMGSNVIELVEAKARVITPDGEVVDFDKSNIKDNTADDGSVDYKYFAIDGAVNGSDIEYTYTVKQYPSYDGSRYTFQSTNLRKNVGFTLVAPENLVFAFKSYNGFPEMEEDTTHEELNVWTAEVEKIPGLKDEDYSAYGKSLMYMVYILDKNKATGSSKFISFGKISQNIYEFYYTDPEKKDKKALVKMLTAIGVTKEKDVKTQILKIENHIKGNIGIIRGAPTRPVRSILEDGYTSPRGATYLMVQALKHLDIKHEIVLGCDRFDEYFDGDFENYSVLKNLMIYYPKLKMYSAPDEMEYRLGIVPAEWTGTDALFIKEISVGGMNTGLGKVKWVEPVDADMTKDKMEVSVDFEDMIQPVVTFKREMSGYQCASFQTIYNLIEEENKTELDESMISFADPKGEVLEYKLIGTEEEDFGVNPMVYTGKLKTTSIIEKAGNRYIFKVGELIGAQAEMYKEEVRETDIEHRHNMIYERKITFEIPDGFELSGLEALNINEVYPSENPSIQFVSSYTQTGNTIEVIVIERYDETHFTKEEINDFRRIINAAANFNKVALFLVKK